MNNKWDNITGNNNYYNNNLNNNKVWKIYKNKKINSHKYSILSFSQGIPISSKSFSNKYSPNSLIQRKISDFFGYIRVQY